MSLKALNLRRYLPPKPTIAENWYENPVQTIPVEVQGEYSQTADGACRVIFGEESHVGFVKPRPDNSNPNVVANEKLASDLAHLLHLPVAPVVIRATEDNWPNFTALSLVCFEQGRHWARGVSNPNDKLLEALESLRIFWSWIGDVDHNGHPENLLYELDGELYKLAAIDHSYSFGHGDSDPLTSPASTGYNTQNIESVNTARTLALEAIEQLEWTEVEHIFDRLVGKVLTESDAIDRLKWLEIRRNGLRQISGI